jgi:TonB family protein
MELFTLSNVTAWTLQTGALALAGTILPRVLRLDVPTIRHAYWRTLLLVCLLLPFIQTWHALPPSTSLPMNGDLSIVSAPVASTITRTAVGTPSIAAKWLRALRATWPSAIAVLFLAGVAIRSAWLLTGIIRLRRMRRAGAAMAPTDRLYDEVSTLVEAGASIRRVPGLRQPLTFGLWRPTVLLPDGFEELPEGLRRAVLAHELWHVRRHDWGWLVAEELTRAVLWFNPAIWWLVSQVQRSREEVVDELTIQLTNARRTYLETLLHFADDAAIAVSAPIADRRHLLQRMLLISKEARMSRGRIVGASMATLLAVVGTVAYGATAFPLNAPARVAEPSSPQTAQAPVRDRRPGEAAPETAREIELKQQLDRTKPQLYLELAGLQEQRGALNDAEATLHDAQALFANNASVLQSVGNFYNARGQFEQTLSAYEAAAALDPSNPAGWHLVATFYWEKAYKDALSAGQKIPYVQRGIEAEDRALAIDPNYAEAVVYKSLLLRLWANLEPIRANQFLAEADELRARALKLTPQMKFQARPPVGRQPGVPPPPPPPPPPPGSPDALPPPPSPDWSDAVRVGGAIKPPIKVRDVKPVYPPIALEARVQGVVIMEVVLDPSGNVGQARVLRGVPLLDGAALDAVKEWQFTPVQVNGVAVPVIMTVTVNFTLPPPQQN